MPNQQQDVFLRACKQVLAAKKTRTQSWLAKGSGINIKTLSRFLLRETVSMDKKNMLALASFLLSDTVSGSLGREEKSQLKIILSEADSLQNSNGEETNRKIERFLLENQDIAIVVYLLCCNVAGLKNKDLFALGEDARFYLQKFLKNKWVLEKDQSYHATNKNFVVKKGLLLQRAACAFMQRMNPERWDEQKEMHNYFYFYTESLSKQGMKKVTDVLVEASKKIESLILDNANHGELPCSMILFQDLLKKM